jgi:hypothetical protein
MGAEKVNIKEREGWVDGWDKRKARHAHCYTLGVGMTPS